MYANPLFHLHFCTSNTLKWRICICDKQSITCCFGYCYQYQHSTTINPRAKALGLIMWSRVDTLGDSQNAVRLSLIIKFYCRKQLSIYLQHCIRGANATKLFVGQNLKLNKKTTFEHNVLSKSFVKRPRSKKSKIGFQDQLSLIAGQKYCRMLKVVHSAILLTFIKLPLILSLRSLFCPCLCGRFTQILL